MNSPYLGVIFAFPPTFAPYGWALCQGQLISISENSALYAVLGTTYGGDGQTTFALPDLRGRMPVGQGQGPGLSSYTMGQLSGSENVTISVSQMPAHTHYVNVYNAAGNTAVPTSSTVLAGSGAVNFFAAGTTTPNATLLPTSIGLSGSSLPVSVIQPVLTTSYIIALQGIFPTQN